MKSFQKYGEWAVVTGGSSGIGKAIAEELAAKGLNIVLVSRTKAQLESTAKELPTQTAIISADLTTAVGREAVFAATKDLDVGLLVHSAGLVHIGPFLSSHDGLNSGLVAIHCTATVELSRHFATRFSDRREGGIVLLSSNLSLAPVPFATVYAAAKAFMISFGEALAEELRGDGVDVLTVSPGGTKTNMAELISSMMDVQKLPLPMGKPEDVARAALSALGRKDHIVPGFATKVMAKVMGFIPTRLAKANLGKMIRRALIVQ